VDCFTDFGYKLTYGQEGKEMPHFLLFDEETLTLSAFPHTSEELGTHTLYLSVDGSEHGLFFFETVTILVEKSLYPMFLAPLSSLSL